MKYVGVVIAGTAFAVGMVWITHIAAGTDWAISVVAVGIAAVWVGDILLERRPSRVTPLQRFEEREQRRGFSDEMRILDESRPRIHVTTYITGEKVGDNWKDAA